MKTETINKLKALVAQIKSPHEEERRKAKEELARLAGEIEEGQTAENFGPLAEALGKVPAPSSLKEWGSAADFVRLLYERRERQEEKRKQYLALLREEALLGHPRRKASVLEALRKREVKWEEIAETAKELVDVWWLPNFIRKKELEGTVEHFTLSELSACRLDQAKPPASGMEEHLRTCVQCREWDQLFTEGKTSNGEPAAENPQSPQVPVADPSWVGQPVQWNRTAEGIQTSVLSLLIRSFIGQVIFFQTSTASVRRDALKDWGATGGKDHREADFYRTPPLPVGEGINLELDLYPRTGNTFGMIPILKRQGRSVGQGNNRLWLFRPGRSEPIEMLPDAKGQFFPADKKRLQGLLPGDYNFFFELETGERLGRIGVCLPEPVFTWPSPEVHNVPPPREEPPSLLDVGEGILLQVKMTAKGCRIRFFRKEGDKEAAVSGVRCTAQGGSSPIKSRFSGYTDELSRDLWANEDVLTFDVSLPSGNPGKSFTLPKPEAPKDVQAPGNDASRLENTLAEHFGEVPGREDTRHGQAFSSCETATHTHSSTISVCVATLHSEPRSLMAMSLSRGTWPEEETVLAAKRWVQDNWDAKPGELERLLLQQQSRSTLTRQSRKLIVTGVSSSGAFQDVTLN